MSTIAPVNCLLTTLAFGCARTSAPAEIQEADAAKGIKIAVGEQFDFVLQSNATTGFQWRLDAPESELTIKKIKNEYHEPNTGAIGAGGTEHWIFEGVRAGTTTVRLSYIRPWEPNAVPDKTVSLTVKVTD